MTPTTTQVDLLILTNTQVDLSIPVTAQVDRTDNSVADKLSASAGFSLLFCTPFRESGRHLLCWPDGSLHHTQDDTWIPSHMPPSLPWIFPKLQTVPQLSLATNDLVRYKVNNQRTEF